MEITKDCAVCQEDYSPGLDFSCSKCSTTSGIARVATSGVLLVSFFVLVFILVNLVSLGPTSDEASNSTSISVLRRLKGTVRLHSLKTIIVVWQIITQASNVPQLPSFFGRAQFGARLFWSRAPRLYGASTHGQYLILYVRRPPLI